MGNTNIFEISLFVLGLLLLGFEIMIPGFGVAGVSGIIAVSAGLVLSMSDIYFALFSLALALVIALILGYVLVKRGIKSEAINRLRLFKESSSDKGYVSVKAEEVSMGDILITKTPLRPTGYAILGDRKIEVVSNTGFIGKDESVVVVRISGARVYVEKIRRNYVILSNWKYLNNCSNNHSSVHVLVLRTSGTLGNCIFLWC